MTSEWCTHCSTRSLLQTWEMEELSTKWAWSSWWSLAIANLDTLKRVDTPQAISATFGRIFNNLFFFLILWKVLANRILWQLFKWIECREHTKKPLLHARSCTVEPLFTTTRGCEQSGLNNETWAIVRPSEWADIYKRTHVYIHYVPSKMIFLKKQIQWGKVHYPVV